MYQLWILVAAVLGIAGALPMKSHANSNELLRILERRELGRNSAIENIIIDAMEDLRQIMLTGSDDIPILDPLHVEHLLADDSVIPIPGARVEMNDLIVSKLSTFELNEVSVTATNIIMTRYSIIIQGEVPVIDVDVGYYDLLINFWGLAIFGKGDAKITVVKPWLKVNADANVRFGLLAIYLNIGDLRLDFGLDDIQLGITGMFNDPSVDAFVNIFLRNLVLELAEFWMDDISDLVSPIVKDVANEILADLNLFDLI